MVTGRMLLAMVRNQVDFHVLPQCVESVAGIYESGGLQRKKFPHVSCYGTTGRSRPETRYKSMDRTVSRGLNLDRNNKAM